MLSATPQGVLETTTQWRVCWFWCW